MSIWDILQQIQIENLKARQVSSESEVERTASRSRSLGAELDDRIERLALVMEAMWELLSERSGVTITDLAARVRQIDARDGHTDGRRGTTSEAIVRCQSCQAVVPVGKAVCQFCGADVPSAKADPFRV